MYEVILTLHVLSAAALGFYLLFPLLSLSLRNADGEPRAGMAHLLLSLNRFGQYMLIVAFLTGGYMVSKHDYLSIAWMVVVILLLVISFAMAGMLSKPLKRTKELAEQGQNADEVLAKIKTFGWIASIVMLLILILMSNRGLI